MENKKQSDRQRKYYFSQVVPPIQKLLNSWGANLDADETHDFIKRHIWKHIKCITTPDGEVYHVLDSCKMLSTVEWERRMSVTRTWAAKFKVPIALPNQSDEGYDYR